jgi:tripartite-type tricarboxylate transporter receptor subunit TctC
VPATGSLPHFFALMMGEKAKVKAQVVGYRGSAPLLNDLIGGQVPIAVDTEDVVLPQHEAGKLRILALSGAKRSPFAPDIPTFKEAGLDLVRHRLEHLLRAHQHAQGQGRAATPRPSRSHAGPGHAAQVQGRRHDARGRTQAQTAAMLKAYRAQWAPVVQKSGYQP